MGKPFTLFFRARDVRARWLAMIAFNREDGHFTTVFAATIKTLRIAECPID